jgi:hypothetical protein
MQLIVAIQVAGPSGSSSDVLLRHGQIVVYRGRIVLRHAKVYVRLAGAHYAELHTTMDHIRECLCNVCCYNTTTDILWRLLFLQAKDFIKVHVLQSSSDLGKLIHSRTLVGRSLPSAFAGSPLVDESLSFWIDSPRNKCTWQASRNSGSVVSWVCSFSCSSAWICDRSAFSLSCCYFSRNRCSSSRCRHKSCIS